MYLYKITNKINNKSYVGITNNVTKRWDNESSYPSDPKRRQAIQEAIHKYGRSNFDFTVLEKGLSIEQAVEKEQRLIKELQTKVPNGYNVSDGGEYHPSLGPRYGADNGRALLTEEEAQYIKNNRNKPLYLLYEEFNHKIGYEAFKDCYYGKTYNNLSTNAEPYPYNLEFSTQFTSGPLEYDEVVDIRKRYANGEYWKNVYSDYRDKYENEWSFWNVYYGNHYRLVMPEVFTEENRKKHSSLGRQGEHNGRAKLTAADVVKIRELYKEGTTTSELYKAYPQVSKTSIRDIINGKTWKNLL